MELITKRECISARIFKNPLYEGCANGGISERFDTVLIPCYNGNIEVELDNLHENFVRLVARDEGIRNLHWHFFQTSCLLKKLHLVG